MLIGQPVWQQTGNKDNSADETSPNTVVEAALMSIAFVPDDLLFIDVRPASGGLDATPRQKYFRGSSVSTFPTSRKICHGHLSRTVIMESSRAGVHRVRGQPALTDAVRIRVHDACRRSANR